VLHEALSNTARHAHATGVEVNVSADATGIRLTVTDNGTGISENGRRSGLANLRERAMQEAYDVFSHAGETGASKAVLSGG
jgi:signal transduction histidine kinase